MISRHHIQTWQLWARGHDGLGEERKAKSAAGVCTTLTEGWGRWSCLSRGSNAPQPSQNTSPPGSRTSGCQTSSCVQPPSGRASLVSPYGLEVVWGTKWVWEERRDVGSPCTFFRLCRALEQVAMVLLVGLLVAQLPQSPAQCHSYSSCPNAQIPPRTVRGSVVPRMRPTPQAFSREPSLFLPSRQDLCTRWLCTRTD